jgi:hypothetical protein
VSDAWSTIEIPAAETREGLQPGLDEGTGQDQRGRLRRQQVRPDRPALPQAPDGESDAQREQRLRRQQRRPYRRALPQGPSGETTAERQERLEEQCTRDYAGLQLSHDQSANKCQGVLL